MSSAGAGGPEGLDLESGRESHGGRAKRYITIIVLVMVLLLLGAAGFIYYRGIMYYRTHFFPNTSINGIGCGNMEAMHVAGLLDAGIDGYVLEVTGRDYRTGESGAVLGVIQASQVGLCYEDMEAAVDGLLGEQNELLWFKAYLGKRDYTYTLAQGVIFDGEMLRDVVDSWAACRKENMVEAQDAYIKGYSEETGAYEIVQETPGTELDVDRAVQLIEAAIDAQETAIDLEGQDCYREAAVTQDDRKLTGIVDTVNRWLGTRIEYDWNGTKVILDNETLKDWISIENGASVLDEEAVAAFVKTQAQNYDTYGIKKSFMTTQGVEVTLNSRNYGWKTDTAAETEELLLLIYRGSKVEREPVYSITARQKGTDDIGDSYVEADLTNQHLYLYQDGEIVLETDFVSGTMVSTYDCVTPEGIYGLMYKTTNAVLKGATYRTPVSYWMPFYGNYGMHDAKWRGAFGGEIYKTNGSHGCINLPPSMAAEIYKYVSEGFPVVCYYYGGPPYTGPLVQPPPEEYIEGWEEDEWEEEEWEEPVEEPAPPESIPGETVEPIPEVPDEAPVE